MDLMQRKKNRVERRPEIENLEKLYPHNVLLYKVPPVEDITIQEFENLALDRLKVLRILEQASSKNLRIFSTEWKDSIINELNQEGLKYYVRLIQGSGKNEGDLQARRKDYISHFILRLAYCRSMDLKRWFITREMELFKLKFGGLSSTSVKQFLELNQLEYTPLTEEQKNEIKDGLYESTFGQSITKIELLDFYKVPFTAVLDLVRGRRCYINSGFAYVNTNDFVSIIGAEQQSLIEAGLNAANRLLPEIENDDRLFHLLKGLHTSYTGKDYTLSNTTIVPIESIDQLSKKSFPLCMRYIHETIRTKHHLKHGGRMQYGLFLKGIGVTLEDSLRFFREEFTKNMDLETFEKRYAYNVRHNYGKEGSMTNYTPYSCMKIITTSVSPQETHGCPFRLLDSSNLKLKLAAYGLGPGHVQEVADYAAKGHYQVACTKYFELSHDKKLEKGINHPNEYFELSQFVMGNRVSKKANNSSAGKYQNRKNANDGLVMKTKDSQLLDDDEELWNLTETNDIKTLIDGTKEIIPDTQDMEKTVWGDDEDEFDMSHIESMDC